MAFTSTIKDKKEFPGGYVIEWGTWAATGGDTSGTITLSTSNPKFGDLIIGTANSNTSTPTAVSTRLVSNTGMALAFTANDTGTYFVLGRAS